MSTNRPFHTTPRAHTQGHAGTGRTEKLLTSREANDPDIQELLVRQALLELLPPVVGTARAARVVHLLLLQQWRSDALLLHWLALHRREAGEEQSRQVNARRNVLRQERARREGEWRRRLRWFGGLAWFFGVVTPRTPKRFRHGLRHQEWLEAGADS